MSFDPLIFEYIKQQTALTASTSTNIVAVQTILSDLTKLVTSQAEVLIKIQTGQIMYQKQTIRLLVGIIAFLVVVIGALLVRLNVQGADVILKAASGVIK